MPLDDPALESWRIADEAYSVRLICEHTFVSERARKYDWNRIREFYEAGQSFGECAARFGFSNGAWHRAITRGDITVRQRPANRPRGATRVEVSRLAGKGLSQAEIAGALGVSKPTVCFHMRRLGIPARTSFARRYDWAQIRRYYELGHSVRECIERFGFSRNAWADAVRRGAIEPRPRVEPIELILMEGRRRNRFHVKTRILGDGLKDARCEGCGLTEWRARPLPFELHHINGDGTDNRLENLQLLCPNCHSQTDTWGDRKKLRLKAA